MISRLFGHLWDDTAQRQTRFEMRLPSDGEGIYFDAEFTVHYTETSANGSGGAEKAVYDHLRRVAEGVTRRSSVLDVTQVELAINAVIGRPVVVAEVVQVDRARVRLQIAAEMKEAARKREMRRLQVEELRHLQRTIFADPVLARLWWLDEHPDRLADLVKLDNAFDRLTALASTPSDGAGWEHIAKVLESFVRDLKEIDKRFLIDRLAVIMMHYGRKDLADRLPRDSATDGEMPDSSDTDRPADR